MPPPTNKILAGASSAASAQSTVSQHRTTSLEIVATHAAARRASWYEPGKLDIFFLGISIVMCGQYMNWNIGLIAGVDAYLIVYVIVGIAYITFSCCMAELTSALPFAGGSYGLARCTLGFFPAFLIGCAEALEYTACVALLAITVCDIITSITPSWLSYRPLLWLLVFFLPTMAIQIVGGATFWIVSTGIGIFQMVLLLIYCAGLMGEVSFSEYAHKDSTTEFVGGLDMAMYVFPLSACFFLGVEALSLASNDVANPKIQVPHGQVACICVVFVTGLWVFLTTVSLPTDGGILAIASALAPLNNGFERLFRVDPKYVILLSCPAQYAGGFGFCWAAAKLVSSMGRSRLLPPWLGQVSDRFRTPHWAIVAVTVVAYGVCLLVYYRPSATGIIMPVLILFAFLSYSGQCIGYILLTRRYPIKKMRHFTNPFGLLGAVYSLLVWIFGIVAILGYQGHNGAELLFFLVVAIVLGIYYRLVARKRQTISQEESKILLVAHIALFNKRKSKSRASKTTASKLTVSPSGRKYTTGAAGPKTAESSHASHGHIIKGSQQALESQ